MQQLQDGDNAVVSQKIVNQVMNEIKKQDRVKELAKLFREAIGIAFDKEIDELNEDEINELYKAFDVVKKWIEDKLFVI